MNVAILGFGNLGKSIANGLLKNDHLNRLYATRKKDDESFETNNDKRVILSQDNTEAVINSDIIILTVQPKQFEYLALEIKDYIKQNKVIISPITGISIEELENKLGKENKIIRCMTNTAIGVGHAVSCLCSNNAGENDIEIVRGIFDNLGHTIIIDEKNMQAATVICASGIAFWMRLIRATAQGGIQLGFESDQAMEMSMKTALGAAKLLEKNNSHPEDEIDKVTTPNGCTIEGLIEMEHQGLSSALIKGLTKSFEKINTMKSE